MSYPNGRIPESALSPIPGGRLSHDAARAWNDMRDFIGQKHGVWIKPLGPNSSYRTLAAQRYYWNLYQRGEGNQAAYPGTSNHGWGKAVDVATQAMAYYIRKYGKRYGWSWDEGRRAGEWWHFRYIGGYKPPKKKNPLRHLTKSEKKHCIKLLRLRKSNRGKNWRKKWSRKERKKEKRLKRWITKRRAHIRKGARSERNGWKKHRRYKRHRVLKRVRDGKIKLK